MLNVPIYINSENIVDICDKKDKKKISGENLHIILKYSCRHLFLSTRPLTTPYHHPLAL